VMLVVYSSDAGRASTQPTTAGSGSGRISSERTLVSRMIIAESAVLASAHGRGS
jgi:hypothetical protein